MVKENYISRNKKLFFLVFISFFTAACSPSNAPVSSIPQTDTTYVAGVPAGDFAPGELEAHYLKHGDQFGGITQEQYLDNARALLNTPPDNDVLGKSRSNGDILRYRVSSGEFAVMTAGGRIRTYFKTDYRYWSKQ